MSTPEMRLTGLGVEQEIAPGHRAQTPDAIDEAVRIARLAGDHLWTVVVAHAIPAQTLIDHFTAEGAGQLLLDSETILYNAVGCYICEREFTIKLAKRRCKGKP